MVKAVILIIVFAVGLFTITGKVCHGDNEYLIMARDAFGIEKGCKFYKQYE